MEIVLRAVVVFFYLWLVTRTVGRSTLGELSTFELLLYVTMGDLVQQAGVMRRQRLGVADLLTAAREQGIRSTREIEYAVLEVDGKLSFFTRDTESPGAPEKPAAG